MKLSKGKITKSLRKKKQTMKRKKINHKREHGASKRRGIKPLNFHKSSLKKNALQKGGDKKSDKKKSKKKSKREGETPEERAARKAEKKKQYSKMKEIADMTPTQKRNYIMTGNKKG